MTEEWLISTLCVETLEGRMNYREHYVQRLMERSMPDRSEIRYILCDDQPEVLEENSAVYENASPSYLIWGILQNGRIGHVLCSRPPDPWVITAYWPDSQPADWADTDYKTRV